MSVASNQPLDFKRVTENDKVSAVIGGSKVSTKLPVKGLLRTDTLVLWWACLYLSRHWGFHWKQSGRRKYGRDGEGALEEAERTVRPVAPCRCRLLQRSQIGHGEGRYQDL
jgi:hypothetical protein